MCSLEVADAFVGPTEAHLCNKTFFSHQQAKHPGDVHLFSWRSVRRFQNLSKELIALVWLCQTEIWNQSNLQCMVAGSAEVVEMK
jgi:hypothetical protein